MKLLTKELRAQLPPIYAQENAEDPMVLGKIFDPCSQWTWYLLEAGPIDEDGAPCEETGLPEADVRFFAYVVGFESELGYVTLSQLQGLRNRFGLPMERDLHFRPCPLSQVRQ